MNRSPSMLQRWVVAVRQWQRNSTGGGDREVSRRRQQVERGQLTEANGLVRRKD